MLVLERRKAITKLLDDQGSVRVAALAARFEVTEETIRRDLDYLESEGRLRRSHGGAVSVQARDQEIPYWFREITHEKEKAAIARCALQYVEEGDRIILDASTTAWHIAKRIRDMDLTVVTNSIRVAVTLSELEKVTVISLGGQLAKRSLSYVGPQAEECMRGYHVNKLFFSCAGIDLERGLSDLTNEQASIRRSMLDQADRRILLVDHGKFGEKALSVVSGFDCIDEIVTNEEAPAETLAQLREAGVIVTVADAKHDGGE